MGERLRRLPRSLWSLAVPLLLIAIGGGGAVLVFQFLVMPTFVRQGQDTGVPDVRGLSLTDAEPLLQQAQLRTGLVSNAADEHIPPGRVMRQNPPPDYSVKQGREVDLVVSLGPEEQRVPPLEGESRVHARFLLAREGLNVGKVRSIGSDEVPADHVVTSSPRPGRGAAGHDAIDLLVSTGPILERYLMPDLRGQDADQMEAALIEAGLTVRRRVRPGARTRLGQIVEQSPPPGHPVAGGGIVEITTGG